MNITRENIKETLRTIMAEESEYQIFFKKALEKAGKSIPSMSDEEKKEFFNKIDAAWNAKGEKNEALKGDQHKLDVDGDGDIEADDLADLRAGKKANESHDCGCGCGGVTEGGCGDTKVTEGVSPKDMESIKGAVQSASSFMNIGSELKKLRMKYVFATSPMPIYVVQDKSGNRVGIVNKKYATKPDFVHGDTAVGVMESLTEGRAFINAARKAKEEGKTEFEFNGKTYPVTIKESVNEGIGTIALGVAGGLLLLKVLKFVLKKVVGVVGMNVALPKEKLLEVVNNMVKNVLAKSSGKQINMFEIVALQSYLKDEINAGRITTIKQIVQVIDKVSKKKNESVNEARLGKVSLLKSVENGDSSYVEGVKISPELAFELRMFLQRPMLARTRTGIAIDNSQMKDAIGMLAKVGIHKRLSSGVKGEFANLLKKYNK